MLKLINIDKWDEQLKFKTKLKWTEIKLKSIKYVKANKYKDKKDEQVKV